MHSSVFWGARTEFYLVAEKLGLDKAEAKFGSVDTTYRYYYGIDTDVVNRQTPKILFDMEPPEWARKRK